MEDAFSGAFLKNGAALSQPVEIVFSSFFDQSSDSTENEWFHAASENGLHAVLLGQVHSYNRGTFDGRETTVGYSVRAVDPTTGTLPWSANVSGSSTWNPDHDPAVYAYEISQRLAEALIYSIQGRREHEVPMPAYLIAEMKWKDTSWLPEFLEVVPDLAGRHGGSYIVQTGEIERLEGTREESDGIVMLQFPDREAALKIR